ncbi:MAG: hypothetical protein K5930_03910 [Treponemataceae bacterium]|nr:hypothetical protein [Treponemataceae bacterium]
MNSRKKKALLIISSFLFIILYLILAAEPIDSSLKITYEWTISLKDDPVIYEEGGLPFKTGQFLGYFSRDGKLNSLTSFPYMASISTDSWTVFGADAEDTPFYTPAGTLVGLIKQAGFPWLTDNGNYLFLPGGTGFDKLDEKGNSLWRYEDISPITAFSNSAEGCIAGYADGKLVSFNNEGKIDYSIYPSGSTYQVILGADISDQNGLTACVCGIDKQRFILFKNTDGQNKIIYHEYLENNLREQTFVKFSKDSKKVFLNDYTGLGIIDCNTLTTNHIPIEGKIIAIEEEPENNMFFVLSKHSSSYSIYIFENPSCKIGKFSFEADNAFIITEGTSLFIGADSTISKYKVIK